MLRIELPMPPHDNHHYTIARGRKILSNESRAYAEQVAWLAISMRTKGELPREPLTEKLKATVLVIHPDKRRRDILNFQKALWDSMQKAEIIKDDSQLDDVRVIRGITDGEAMVIVTMHEIPDLVLTVDEMRKQGLV